MIRRAMRAPSTTASQSVGESRKFGRIAGAANGSDDLAWTVPMDSGRRTQRPIVIPGSRSRVRSCESRKLAGVMKYCTSGVSTPSRVRT